MVFDYLSFKRKLQIFIFILREKKLTHGSTRVNEENVVDYGNTTLRIKDRNQVLKEDSTYRRHWMYNDGPTRYPCTLSDTDFDY